MTHFFTLLLWTIVSGIVFAFRCALSHIPQSISEQTLADPKTLFFYSPFQKRFFNPYEAHVLKALSSLTGVLLALGFGIATLISSSYLLQEQRPILYIIVIVLWTLVFGALKLLLELFAEKYAKKALKLSAPIAAALFYPVSLIFYPLLQLHKNYCAKVTEEGGSNHHMEEILEAIEETSPTSVEEGDRKLIRSALSLKETKVREIMIPRINLFCLESSLSVGEAARLCHEEGYSRVPVYTTDIDHIIGILMVKDLIEVISKQENGTVPKAELDKPIETLVKKVLYVPESKKISLLLQEFRTKHTHLAIVVDEYGGTKGVVTIEDILEEIVGEIEDEYDEEESDFVEVPSGGWIVSATMSIVDIEDKLGIDIPSHGEYDTLGGYVFHKSGMIPKKGFIIHSDDFKLEILSSNDRKVEKVKITPTAKAS